MKKQLTLLFTALCILFLSSSCEKDLQEEVTNSSSSTNSPPFSTRVVSFKDIPGIADYTNQKLRGMASKSGRNADDGMLIDENSIIENIDTLGNKNYSVHFVYDDTSENIFYNLIINEPASGEKKAYVLKYICNPEDFTTFKAHNFDFNYFVGVTELSSIGESTGNKLSARNNNDDECPKILIPSADTAPGASSGTGGGGGGFDDTENSGSTTTVIGYNASAGSSGGVSSVTIGGITYYAGGGSSGGGGGIDIPNCNCYNTGGWVALKVKLLAHLSRTSSQRGSCREETVPEGYVPVNTQSQLLWLRTLIGLNAPQFVYLRSHPETVPSILAYLAGNTVNGVIDPEATNFAKEAIDALIEGGEVDFKDEVILHSSFVNTKTNCAHIKMTQNQTNIYAQMLSVFNSSTNYNLTMKVGNPPNGDWGITKRDSNISNSYEITINSSLENTSNLTRTATLCHELIHAYMLNSMEGFGLVTFDTNGDPLLNLSCSTTVNYNNVNLNSLSVQDRFIAMICAMNQNATLTPQWTHELFNSNFTVATYRQEIENMIYNIYDWNNENAAFKAEAINLFGSSWKREIAKASSYVGLEKTSNFINYINGYSSNTSKFLYLMDFRNKMSTANNDCP
ncbi:MAG TPA: hypothetical protein VF677_16440 [Flavobacterium sp.]|jgi:hypothetical protein